MEPVRRRRVEGCRDRTQKATPGPSVLRKAPRSWRISCRWRLAVAAFTPMRPAALQPGSACLTLRALRCQHQRRCACRRR